MNYAPTDERRWTPRISARKGRPLGFRPLLGSSGPKSAHQSTRISIRLSLFAGFVLRISVGWLRNRNPDRLLGTGDSAVLFKAGKELLPFVEGCHDVQVAHPAILPGVFNADEFDRDYRLARDLGTIAEALDQLNTAVGQTLMAVRSDALAEALEVYGAVKANRDRVPGLDVAAQNLGRYFQRPSRAAARA